MCDSKPGSKLLRIFIPLLCVLADIADRISACPKSCACYTTAEVHCTFRYLSEIPHIHLAVERVNLGYNSLMAVKVNDFSGLTNLELLLLHSNLIKIIEDGSFHDLKSLQVLKMSYNRVEKLDKETFRGMKHLVRLHMDHNHITFIHPESLYGLQMLQLINLEGNQLQQLHPDTFISLRYSHIFKWSSLKTIYLSDNALTTLPATVFSGCYKIENLFLSGNPWSCNCQMRWLANWTKKNPGVLKCKRDRKIAKEQLCPVCQFPVSLKGSNIVHLPDESYTCTRPWIHPQLKQRNFTLESDYISVSSKDFVGPIGMLEINITDLFQNNASITCVVQGPVAMDNLTVTYGVNRNDVHALSVTVSTSLVCNIDYDHISQIWNILAIYSDSPMRLERGLLLSLQPDTVYAYKQVLPSADDIFTESNAKIKANPSWLMQSIVNLQLDRFTTTFPTLNIKYLSNVHIDVDSSKDSRDQYNWTMIRRDNQTKTEHSVLAGGVVELNCEILGDPKPIIEWILPDKSKVRAPYNSEDQRIVVTNQGRLTLGSAERSNAGVYHCIATNYLAADVLSFRVTILAPDIKEEEVNGGRVLHSPGQNLLLDCTTASSPQASVQWILPDKTVLDKSFGNRKLYRNGTLVIHGLTSQDTGIYRCLAANFLGADLLVIQVTVFDDLSNSTKKSKIKQSSDEAVQIIDDNQKLRSRHLLRNVNEESKSITSGKPYTWLQSRFLNLPTGRRGNRRTYGWTRQVFNKGTRKVVPEKFATFIKNSQNKEKNEDETVTLQMSETLKTMSENSDTISGDGISEDEFIVMSTQIHEHKPVNNIEITSTKIPQTNNTTVNSGFTEKNNKYGSDILGTNKKLNLVTSVSYSNTHSQTHTTPITASYTPSNYGTQQMDELLTTNPDYVLNYSNGKTYIHERKINRPSGQPVTLSNTATEVADKIGLLFSEDSDKVATGETPQYNFQNSNVTHLEQESQNIYTAVTSTEREQDKITFHSTQTIKSPHLLPGSTIISKHQIQIIPTRKKHLGKRRNFHGRHRIIRPSKIIDIQHLLDKFKRLSVKNEDNHTSPHTVEKITNCDYAERFKIGILEKCKTTVNRSLVNHTDSYYVPASSQRWSEKLVLTTPGTHLSTSIKTNAVTDSQMPLTMTHSKFKEPSNYTNSVNSKERELTKDAMSTPFTIMTTKPLIITQENRKRQFKHKCDLKESLSRGQKPFSPSTVKKQMSTSTAAPVRTTTAVTSGDSQLPHIIASPPITKEDYMIAETSVDDTSGFSSYTKSDSSYQVITLLPTEFPRFPAFHELSTTTESVPVSHTLSTSPTIKTELKQDAAQDNFSGPHTGLWGNQKPGFQRRGFKGRGQINKTTMQAPIIKITEISDKPSTSKSTTIASRIQHRGVAFRPLHTPFKKEMSPSTVNTDSDNQEWRNLVLSFTNIPQVITASPLTNKRPTVFGSHTTPQSQIKSNASAIQLNTNKSQKRGWRYTTQRPMMSVQPTVHKKKYTHCFECPRANVPNSVPIDKNKERTVSSDTMTVQTAENYYTPSSRKSDAGNVNAYDRSTESSSNTTRSKTSVANIMNMPRITGGKAASFTVLSNSDAFLPCNVTGNPRPSISWSRFSSTTGNMLTIRGKMGKYEVLTNGTLTIQRTNIKDHGQYICFAQNKHGSDKLIVTLSVVAYPTRILEPKVREIKVLAGKTVEMECKTEGRPVPIVSWILPNHTEFKSPNPVHGRVAVTSEGTLTMQNVSVFDRGHYKCFATNPGGTDTATVCLQVIAAPPVILEKKQQLVRADVGQNLYFPCTTHGDPLPTTHWVLNDGTILWPLTFSNTKISVFLNGTLYLRNVEITESGKYACIATSSTGSEQRVVTLSVKRTETAPQITKTSQQKTDLEYGGRLQLNCSAIGDPKPHIIWRLPSRAVVDQSYRMGNRMKVQDNGTLIIESVNEKDAGDFHCVARNKVGDDVQLMIVSVSMKPARIKSNGNSKKQVSYGSDLKVDCVAAGIPIPKISWSLPDGTLVNSALQADETGDGQSERYTFYDNGTLYLSKVETDEEGDYTCYAENKLGKDKMHVHVSVITAAPRIHPPNHTYTKVKTGGNVRFDCKAIGEPKPKVLWMLPSKDIIAASNERYLVHANGSLDIRNIKLANAGEYVCMARNLAGEENKVYKLDIDGNPPIINGFKQNRTVIKDIAVKYSRKLIDCKAEAYPLPTITWIMPDNIFLTAPYYGSRINVYKNGTLEIRNVRPSDEAEFICMAQNDEGEAVMLVQLEVTNMLMRPIFKNPLNERLVTGVGSTAVLNCSADGKPKPEIIWVLPNKTRFSGGSENGSRYHLGKDGTLVIYNSSKDDTGKYRCAAKNEVGYIEKLIVLEVFQKPYILTRPRGIIRSVSGEPLFLHCLTGGGKARISWIMPGRHVLAHSQVNGRYRLMENGTLVVRDTTVLDRGNYVCQAKNDAGEAVLTVPVIIIAFPPRIINGPLSTVRGMTGVPVHLPCVANGIPKPDITWELPDGSVLSTTANGRPVVSQLLHRHGTLIIQNPTRADSGHYRCTAVNYLGRDTKITSLIVI